jgi:O-antigen/teichoic acid export membrane protein
VASLRSLAKETMIYGLSYSLGRLINFLLVTSYLTRVFGNQREYFSIYNEMYFFIALFLGMLTLRMETTFFRFASDEKYQKAIYPLASQMVFIASALFILAVYLFISSIEHFLQYPNLRTAIYYSSWIIILDVICSLPFSKLRFKKQAFKYAWIKSSGLFLNIALVLLFLKYATGNAGEKLTLVILANLISSLLNLILLFPEIKESFVKADWSYAKKIFNYSFPLIIVTLSFIFIQYGGTSILKYFLPGSILQNLDQSSLYNAAFRLAVIMNLFVTAFNYAAEPFFFRHVNQDNSRQVFARVSLFYILSCCVIYLATCLFIDDVAMLLAKNYRGQLYLVNILLLANIFTGLYANISSWYKLSDRNSLMAAISISGLALMIAINVFLVPILGNSSAAIANLISYLFICAVSYYQGQKHFPIPYPVFKMTTYLLFCILLVWTLPLIYANFGFGFWIQHGISLLLLSGFCGFVYLKEIKLNTIN